MLWLLDLINPESKIFIGFVVVFVISLSVYLLRKLQSVDGRKRGGYGEGVPLVMMFAIQPLGLYIFPLSAIQGKFPVPYALIATLGVLTIPLIIIKLILISDPYQKRYIPRVGFIASIYIGLGVLFAPIYWVLYAAKTP